MHRDELLRYLDELLQAGQIADYSFNGLQVEGRDEVRRLVVSVSACAELFRFAVQQRADAVLVHHGILWQGQDPRIRGLFRERLKILLENDLNLYAYHLPLDKHPELGNNGVAARALGLKELQLFAEVGYVGVHEGLGLADVLRTVKELYGGFGNEPLVFAEGPEVIHRIAILSGGGGKYVGQAVEAGADLLLTGEAAEPSMNLAREGRIHFVAAGHYATERLGVRALADHLSEQLGLEVIFHDIPNPV